MDWPGFKIDYMGERVWDNRRRIIINKNNKINDERNHSVKKVLTKFCSRNKSFVKNYTMYVTNGGVKGLFPTDYKGEK